MPGLNTARFFPLGILGVRMTIKNLALTSTASGRRMDYSLLSTFFSKYTRGQVHVDANTLLPVHTNVNHIIIGGNYHEPLTTALHEQSKHTEMQPHIVE